MSIERPAGFSMSRAWGLEGKEKAYALCSQSSRTGRFPNAFTSLPQGGPTSVEGPSLTFDRPIGLGVGELQAFAQVMRRKRRHVGRIAAEVEVHPTDPSPAHELQNPKP